MRLLLLLLVSFLTTVAVADGMFVIRGSLTADIPFQRGVVAYKDGTEKLVIENTINSPDPNASWVVPIPAQPTQITFAHDSNLFFARAESVYRPMVHRSLGYLMWPWWLLGFGPLLLVALTAPFRLPKDGRRLKKGWSVVRTFTYEMTIASCVALVFFLMMPVYGGGRSSSSGIEVTHSEQIGNYQVSVIKGDQTRGLLDWLANNDTPLPPQAAPIVEDYAKKGWRFLVAKLRPQPEMRQGAHPLVVTFPSEEPVYPMRLTSLSPKPVVLELYVIANGTARIPQLDLWSSREALKTDPPDEFIAQHDEYLMMSELTWPGATVSRLRKKLDPNEMTEDYAIEVGPAVEYKREVWTEESARDEMMLRAIQWFGIGVVVSSFFGVRKRPATWLLLMLGVGAIAALVAVVIFKTSAYIAF